MAANGRSAQRSDMDVSVRVRLLEGDADEFDGRFDKLDGRLESIQRSVMAGAVSLIVGALLLAANLAVGL